jgi:hypothetical protein
VSVALSVIVVAVEVLSLLGVRIDVDDSELCVMLERVAEVRGLSIKSWVCFVIVDRDVLFVRVCHKFEIEILFGVLEL